MQASREEDHAYTEIAERILVVSHEPKRDLVELWRRIVFSMLITNVDDHLQNHGFLHVAHGQWRLAPAFDVNPMPDKDRELKTWLTEDSDPTGSVEEAVAAAGHFRLARDAACGKPAVADQICGVSCLPLEARAALAYSANGNTVCPCARIPNTFSVIATSA